MWTCFSCHGRWCVGKRPANNWMQRSVCGIKPSLKADWWVWLQPSWTTLLGTLWPLFLLLSSHFFTSKNVLKWVMLQMCWEWNISPQTGFLSVCLLPVSVLRETPGKGAGWPENVESVQACKSNNTNTRLVAFTLSLALNPTFWIHSHKTLDTAQPCHLLKPN